MIKRTLRFAVVIWPFWCMAVGPLHIVGGVLLLQHVV
jgi:hypothetical protein